MLIHQRQSGAVMRECFLRSKGLEGRRCRPLRIDRSQLALVTAGEMEGQGRKSTRFQRCLSMVELELKQATNQRMHTRALGQTHLVIEARADGIVAESESARPIRADQAGPYCFLQ